MPEVSIQTQYSLRMGELTVQGPASELHRKCLEHAEVIGECSP